MLHASNYPFTINKVQLSNGSHLAYIDEGTGPETLLFIHGLATYGFSWQKNIETLKKHYRCIAIDLPGNGFSDRGDFSYSINFFAVCIFDFIKKTGLKNVNLVGHSMGGQIAMTILLNEPTAAKKLVLCATAGFETFNTFERNIYHSSINFFDMFSSDENSLRKTIRSSFYNYPTQADEMIDELADLIKTYPSKEYHNMIEACIKGMLSEPVFEKLGQIQQPTLVMYGERDALIPNRLLHPTTTRSIAEQGIKKMPHAKLEMVSQCGHFLQWEKAETINRLIHHFIG